MKTKNIFKALAFAMLMPAVLLTTSCSKGDDLVNNTAENTKTVANKGYALPVTVNVTRQGDGTRATYNDNGDGTGSLGFSAGDKLFVSGSATTAGRFAGELTWQSGETFSGTIYTENSYEGTADELFSAATPIFATLLPNGYESTGFLYVRDSYTTEAYDDVATARDANAFVASETAKATGVEQLSYEGASTYSSGFALAPMCAVLNFTISGLEAGAQNVTLNVTNPMALGPMADYTVTGIVTPNASGVATFAIGVKGGVNIKDMENNLTVGSHNFTLPSSTTFTAGKIYNITRSTIPGALVGKFTINAGGDQVYFSKGNLRYVSGTWSFFDHQYDCYDTYSADAWDKFGWSTSSTYGMSTSTNVSYYLGSFVDWGAVTGIGEGWYTLSKDEWAYLFNDRSGAASKYGYATVNGVHGIIILPDAFVDPNKNKGSNAFVGSATDWDANEYTAANWALMEAAGAVFLPAAGCRSGDSVSSVGSIGDYWSSSAYEGSEAYDVSFSSSYVLSAEYHSDRYLGLSVRLVHQP